MQIILSPEEKREAVEKLKIAYQKKVEQQTNPRHRTLNQKAESFAAEKIRPNIQPRTMECNGAKFGTKGQRYFPKRRLDMKRNHSKLTWFGAGAVRRPDDFFVYVGCVKKPTVERGDVAEAAIASYVAPG